MSTQPLRDVLAEALPERPFRVELWDGEDVALEASLPDGTVTVRGVARYHPRSG